MEDRNIDIDHLKDQLELCKRALEKAHGHIGRIEQVLKD